MSEIRESDLANRQTDTSVEAGEILDRLRRNPELNADVLAKAKIANASPEDLARKQGIPPVMAEAVQKEARSWLGNLYDQIVKGITGGDK